MASLSRSRQSRRSSRRALQRDLAALDSFRDYDLLLRVSRTGPNVPFHERRGNVWEAVAQRPFPSDAEGVRVLLEQLNEEYGDLDLQAGDLIVWTPGALAHSVFVDRAGMPRYAGSGDRPLIPESAGVFARYPPAYWGLGPRRMPTAWLLAGERVLPGGSEVAVTGSAASPEDDVYVRGSLYLELGS